MFWKIILVASLAVGILAEYQIPEEHREQFKEMTRLVCKKNGAEDKAEEVQKSITSFVSCVKDILDVDVIKKEIEEAKPRGALDEVFGKYCAKSPQLKTCINELTVGVRPCVHEEFRENLLLITNVTDQLLNFLCEKEGDKIAIFIAEGGPECFQEKMNPIRDCFQKTRESVTSVEDFRKLDVAGQCKKYDELSSCIVKALEECSTPTPGNMAESLFKFIRKVTPCAGK